jgi:hypothetical protein
LSHLFIATSLRRGLRLFIILLTFFSHTFDMGAVGWSGTPLLNGPIS